VKDNGINLKLQEVSMQKRALVMMLVGSMVSVACVREDVIKTAQEKELVVEGQTLKLGGTYNETRHELELTVNGDPIMKGVFRDYTPTQNLKVNYKGLHVSSYCYFASVLGKKGGLFGAIARGVQTANEKAGDECEISVNGQPVEKLYF
jgi:hypothetical protein